MRRFKKSIVVMISVLAVLAAACSNSTTPANSPSNSAAPGGNASAPASESSDAAQRQVVEVELMVNGDVLPEGGTDFIKQKLEEQLDMKINLNSITAEDDYRSQLSIRLASGDYPDLMQVNRQQMQQFARQDLLLDLTPYLDKLQPVVDYIGQDSIGKATVDGKVVAIAKRNNIPYLNNWIRQDWLDNLNLSSPTTLEELMDVLIAFTENDPDGNQQHDTYGISGPGTSAFNSIYGAFASGTPNTFYLRDGKVINSLYDPNIRQALEFIKGMVDAGVVDPDLLANTGTQYVDKAHQGKVGMIWSSFVFLTHATHVEKYKAVNPNAEWVQIVPPKGPNGQFAGGMDIGSTSMLHAISKDVEKDPVKLERMLDMMNYIASEEGSEIVLYGEEGRHFNRVDGRITPTELRGKEMLWMYQFLGRDDGEYLKVTYPPEAIDFNFTVPRMEILNGFLDFPADYNPADVNRYIDEEFAKFIYGKRSLNEYDDFLNTLETTFKFKDWLDSANAQFAALGIGQ